MTRRARPHGATPLSALTTFVLVALVAWPALSHAAATEPSPTPGSIHPFALAWSEQGTMQYPFALAIENGILYSTELHGLHPSYEIHFAARDVATSELLWSHVIDRGEYPDGNGGITVLGDRILFEDHDSNLMAFGLDGQPLWTSRAPNGNAWNPLSGGPAVIGGTVTRMVEGETNTLVATDLDGQLLWTAERPHSHGAPVGHDGTFVHVAYHNVSAWRPDGTLAWSMVPPSSWAMSPPAVGDYLYIVDLRGDSNVGTIHITAIDQGQVVWTRSLHAPQWPPAGDPDSVYRPAVGNGLVAFNVLGLAGALDAATGATLWTDATGYPYRTPPVVAGDQMILRSRVSQDSWELQLRDAGTGSILYRDERHQLNGQDMATAVGDGFFATASGGPIGDLLVFGPDFVAPQWPNWPGCEWCGRPVINEADDGTHDVLGWGDPREHNPGPFVIERQDGEVWVEVSSLGPLDRRWHGLRDAGTYRVVATDMSGNRAPSLSVDYSGSWHDGGGGGGGTGSPYPTQPTDPEDPDQQPPPPQSHEDPETPAEVPPEEPPREDPEDRIAVVENQIFIEAGTFGLSDRNPRAGATVEAFVRLVNPYQHPAESRVHILVDGGLRSSHDVRLQAYESVLWAGTVRFEQEGDHQLRIATEGPHPPPPIPDALAYVDTVVPVGATARASAEASIVVSAGLVNFGTVATGEVRTVPVDVTAYNGAAHGVRLQVLDTAGGILVEPLTPPTTVQAGQTVQFYLRITGAELAENQTSAQASLIFQAVAGTGLASNVETLTVVTHHEDLRGIPFLGAPAVAAAVATGGGLLALFRRRHRDG